MVNKYEHLRFLIERFDHYYDTINSKGAFYIGLNTFIFGGICVGYTSLYNKITAGPATWSLLVLIILLCFASIFYTIFAMKPYTKDNFLNDDTPSLIFFGGIARHEYGHFSQKFQDLTDETVLTDLTRQAHSLAKGLTLKFKRLKSASHFLFAQFILMLPLFFIIIKNLK